MAESVDAPEDRSLGDAGGIVLADYGTVLGFDSRRLHSRLPRDALAPLAVGLTRSLGGNDRDCGVVGSDVRTRKGVTKARLRTGLTLRIMTTDRRGVHSSSRLAGNSTSTAAPLVPSRRWTLASSTSRRIELNWIDDTDRAIAFGWREHERRISPYDALYNVTIGHRASVVAHRHHTSSAIDDKLDNDAALKVFTFAKALLVARPKGLEVLPDDVPDDFRSHAFQMDGSAAVGEVWIDRGFRERLRLPRRALGRIVRAHGTARRAS